MELLGWLIWVPLLWWQFRGAPRVLDWMAVRDWIKPPSHVPASVGGAPSHRDFLVMCAVFLLPWGMLLALLAA